MWFEGEKDKNETKMRLAGGGECLEMIWQKGENEKGGNEKGGETGRGVDGWLEVGLVG